MEDLFESEMGGGAASPELAPAQPAGSPLPPPSAEPSTAPTGEFDVFIKKLVDREDKKSAADRSMALAITRNPDEYARYLRLSKLTGMDPDMLLEEPDMRQEAERRTKLGAMDFDSLVRTNPKTVEFLSDPQNAAIAQDDLPFFQRIENSFRAIGSGYRTAETQEEMFALARKWMDEGKLSPVEMARLEKLQGDEEHKSRVTAGEGVPEYVGRAFGYSARQFFGSTKATLAGAGAGGLTGYAAGSMFPVVGNIAGGTAGVVAGGITGGAAYSYDMERAGAFLELSRTLDLHNNPIDPAIARTVANAVGVVNAAIEVGSNVLIARMVPGVKEFMGQLSPNAMKNEMKRKAAAALANPTTRQIVLQAAGKIGGGATIEGLEEFIQSLFGAAGREVAQAASGQQFKDDNLSDDLKQASAEALQAFTGTLFIMAPAGAMHYSNMRHQQQVQLRNKDFFDALASATDSKAHQRLPEATRNFVESLKQDSEVKNVFIDAERANEYFQSKGVDTAAVMEQVLGPEGAQQFEQALALGGDMIIPVEAYAEKLAGTEHHQGLVQDLRLKQGDMSEREFKLAEANLSEDEKTLRDMSEAAHAQIAADEPAQRVYRDMYGEALAAGAPPSQASAWAAIEAARYRVRASRMGDTDAYSLWREEGGLMIRRLMPEVLSKYRGTEPVVDSLLDMMRERRIPQDSPDKQLTDAERTTRAQVNELGGVLDALGIDVDSLTNEQIRSQLFVTQEVDTEGGTVYNAGIDGQTYDQALDVYKYSNGLLGFASNDFILSAPADLGAWVDDSRSVGYDIEDGRNRVGTAVLAVRGDKIIGLSAIEIAPESQRSGLGGKVVRALVEQYGQLDIYGIRDSAVEFWKKMGVQFDETQNEIERNGVITKDSLDAATRASGRDAGVRQAKVGAARSVKDFIDAGLVSTSGLIGPQQMFRATRPGQSTDLVPGSWITDSRDIADNVYAPGISGRAAGTVTEHTIPGEHLIRVHPGGYIYVPPGTDISNIVRYVTPEGEQVTLGSLLERAESERTFYQTAPIWYSALHQSVAAVKASKSPANQWIDIIRGLKGVKKDEIKWSGIEEWLQLQGDATVTRDQVLQYLDGNGVQVEETVLGAETDADLSDAEEAEYIELHRRRAELAADERARLDELHRRANYRPAVKFSDYQLPGGENYRELLLRLPGEADISYKMQALQSEMDIIRQGRLPENMSAEENARFDDALADYDALKKKRDTTFRSSHFDQPNILAHVRFNERTDADGKRVLFLEEIQSDWAQKGRKEGFRYEGVQQRAKQLREAFNASDWAKTADEEGRDSVSILIDNWAAGVINGNLLARRLEEKGVPYDVVGIIHDTSSGTFAAPFVTETKAWVALALKRMIRYAAENGFDRVAWTTGEQQVDTYRESLRKVVDTIQWRKTGDGVHILGFKDGHQTVNTTEKENAVSDAIGKTMADRIKNDHSQSGEIKGTGITIDDIGMSHFYGDQSGRKGDGTPAIITVVANELLKKFGGGKVGEVEIVRPNAARRDEVLAEIEAEEGTPRRRTSRMMQPGFDITPAMRKSALLGMPLFQPKRGSVTLGEGHRLIQLFEDADLSTFLHELGHTWLEELQRDAQRDGASEAIRADWETVRGWLGVAPNEAIPVAAHEKWARGTEAYFMEGNAPSIALRELFHKFKAWVMSVYKDVSELDVKINDDIRGVMDRLIATDEEIERAQQYQMYAPMFSTPEQAKMTPAEWSAYTKATEDARTNAQEQLTRRVMRELRRENEKWWKEELARVEGAVRAEARKMPAYKAIWLLTRGEFADGTKPDQPVKLSKSGLIATYGEAYLKELSPQRLHTSGWIYSAEGGIHHDVIAGMVGFDSGDEMIKAITSAPPMSEWIAAEAKQRMLELHGDMMSDGGIADEAIRAAHNDRQAEALEIELRILNRKRSEVDPILRAKAAEERAAKRRARQVLDFNIPAAVLRDLARREIGAMRVGTVDPIYYSQAEAKAGREAFNLAAKGDYDGAAEAKQRQIMNHFFYREAIRARKDVDRGVGHMTRLSKSKARARIGRAGQEWLEQLDTILERYSLSPFSRQKKARTLLEWAKAVEQATGESIAISPEVLDEAHMVNYRELTVDQFRALHDSVSSIEHVARKITQVVRNGKNYEKAEMVTQLVNAAEKSLTIERPLPETEKVYGQARTAWELTRGFFAANLRPEKIIERLDGGKSGIWHDLFWNPAVDAQTQRDELRIMVMKPLAEMQKAMSKERQARMSDGVFLQTLGKTLTRRTLIGVALNVGNASNRDKLMRGGMWFGQDWSMLSEVQLAEMLGALDEQDWKMVQTMWDSVALLYPHLDDLNRRAVGLPLDRVEPTPITTPYGVFAGGYWPAVADPRHSKIGERQENAETLATELFAPRYPKAATMHSFREARTEAAYPIQLDWERVLSNHINKAITDIAYHEWIKQARRLLESQDVKKVIQNRLGEHVYRSMEEWLVHQVAPVQGGYSANAAIDNITNSLISNTAIAALGFKAATAIGNIVVAPMQASHQISPIYMVRGLAKYLSNPAKATEAVFAMSGEMRHRYEHLDQTFNTILKTLEGRNTIRAQIGYWAMQIHRLADRWTSTFLWMAKYQQEIDGGRTVDEAKRLADKTIRTTQMAGAPKDLSSFERDPRYRMFKLFIGPMIVMQNEMRGAVAGKGIKAAITPSVWATMFATWILPAVFFELAVGRGPDDPEDFDEWWQWALLKILVYPAITVPFVRDAANAIEQTIQGKHAMTRSNPIADVVMLLAGAVKNAMKEDAEFEDFAKAAAKATGVAVGLPTSQVVLTGEFLYDTMSGERELEGPEDLRYLIYKRKDQ